jgi:serine/threonine protein phosphatase PrpC
MTAGPNTNSTECNREKLVNALSDEALIKQLEAAIYSNEIWEKALDVVCKRIASGEVSDNMLLHVVVSLSKSTAVLSYAAERRRS